MALASALSWWHPLDYDSVTDAMSNRGSNTGTMQLGSTVGADTNDPVYLSHPSLDYIWIPESTGATNRVTTTITAIATDAATIESFQTIRFDDLTPANAAWLWDASDAVGSTSNDVGLFLSSGGDLTARLTDGADATDDMEATVTLATAGLVIDTLYEIRMLIVDVDTATPDATFFWRIVGATTWTQIGDLVTGSTDGALITGMDSIRIGAESIGGGWAALQVDVDGTTAFEFIPEDIFSGTQASFTSGTNTWTVTRHSSGTVVALVDRPMLIFDGSDDYCEAADDDAYDFGTGDYSLAFAGRGHNTVNTARHLISRRNDAVGWSLDTDGNAFAVRVNADADDDRFTSTTDIYDSVAFSTQGGRDSGDLEAFFNGVGSGSATTSSTDVDNDFVVRLCVESDTIGGAASQWAGEFYGAAVWDTALTDAEILAVHNAMILPEGGGSFVNLRVAGAGELLRTGS